MTSFRLLPLAALGLLLSFSVFAQNYNAGVGSGTGGNFNVMVGPYAGRITTSNLNSFVGYKAGYFNTTGSDNSFVGSVAGYYNTTGSNNSFVGSYVGVSNTTGDNNSFVGSNVGASNTTGDNNSFVGSYAGYFNTIGRANSFLGSDAGRNNTTGYYNSFLGHRAGLYNTTGAFNSFIGSRAGNSNTTGNFNSIVGSYAGFLNTTGNQNAFVGFQAGYSSTTASNNTFIGFESGYATTTTGNNAFLGYHSGRSNTTGYNNTFLGALAGFSNTTGIQNSFNGNGAGQKNTTGAYNTSHGYKAGLNNTTGSNNLFLGSNTNAGSGTLSNAAAIGSKAYVTASNSLVLGSINKVNGATASTKVGIGTSAPTYLLHVNGTAAKPGGGSWTVASDKRLKKNISNFTEGIDVLTKIKPVWFEYNGEAGMPTDEKYVGIIAQEIQKIAPYTVGEFTYQDSTGKQEKYLDYDANALTYILVNSVKEIDQKYSQQLAQKDAQINSQQQEINTLTNQLKQLEAAVDKLTGESVKATDASAQLYQNTPNPTEGTTVIGYFLPKEAASAQLKIYSVTGVEVQSIELTGRGKGQVSLSVGQLATGQYIYHLLVDGQSVASKKLLLNR
jgi:hypothetical protein